MGVSGCGKTSFGSAFADAIGARFVDGDDLHPAENIAKMSRGEPLEDADRFPWLQQIGEMLQHSGGPVVVGCSALKRRYRDLIRDSAGQPVTFLHLSGPKDLIASYVSRRQDHFMPASLVDSQFAALEPPGPDEDAITVSIDQDPQGVLNDLLVATGALRHE
ncbi:gluconokinase [Roseibium sp. RKSG952]|nr:gluconokinase [Roseibium sp. RKSG952]